MKGRYRQSAGRRAARAAHDASYTDYVEKWAGIYEARSVESLLDIGPTVPNPAAAAVRAAA